VLDIVAENVGNISPASRDGVRGCAVIQAKAAELLDLDFVGQRGLRDLVETNEPVHAGQET